jgi:2-polyprenyl-3-methyl-5-hydroxy-6-metoxy-1,4-benzoquinol methylase
MSSLTSDNLSGYHYGESSELAHTASYLLPALLTELKQFPWATEKRRIFEVGCGNGAVANFLTNQGYEVIGIDPSKDGIENANRAYPQLKLEQGSAYDDLAVRYGQFEVVISFEVVEHVFYPRQYAKSITSLLKPGGIALISTPYHAYLKNLLIAITGKWDHHHSPLWDYGHIKFWSMKTLTALLEEAGLSVERYHRVGRIPILAKSMIAVASKK